MRGAFMSIQLGIKTYAKDMTFREYVELGDSGARRRR